jgi:glycosyltransferase involved in cell wall biosynthesis
VQGTRAAPDPVVFSRCSHLKILIPIIGFGRAGGYRVLSELATQWVRAGHEVDFLVDHRAREPYFPTAGGVRCFDRQGLVEARMPKGGGFAESGNAKSIFLGMWRALWSISGEYDIVLANQSLTAWPVRLSPKPKKGRFYYVQAYEPDYYALEQGIKARMLECLSRLSYHLTLRHVVNSPIYLRYKNLRAEHWVPPGLDLNNFKIHDNLPGSSSGWTLGLIGRREPAKGTPDALAAFELIAARHPSARLRVAYGNLPDGWSHPRAEVVVPANDRELADFYRSLDVLMAPGTQQLGACHYPVMEAMACGVPVITTGYLPADPSNAWIVPVHDPLAIAKAFDDILAQTPSQLRFRLDRATRAIQAFGWEPLATKFLSVLNMPRSLGKA